VLLDVWPAVQRRMMACTGFLAFRFSRIYAAAYGVRGVSIIFTFRPPDALL
jgi:hypothetical protein